MKLTLLDKKVEVENVISFIFEPEAAIFWRAGQYMRYKLEDPNSPENMSRFFTISAAPFEKNIMLTTKFVPNDQGSFFKKRLQELGRGQVIEAIGPNGDFVIEDPNLEYVFIAGGIGITPFRSMLLQLDHDRQPIKVTLLYANRTEQIVFKEELESIAQRNPGLKIHYFIGENRIDEKAIQSLIVDRHSLIFYISGPQNMVRVMESLVSSLGVPEEKITHDYFPGYTEI